MMMMMIFIFKSWIASEMVFAFFRFVYLNRIVAFALEKSIYPCGKKYFRKLNIVVEQTHVFIKKSPPNQEA